MSINYTGVSQNINANDVIYHSSTAVSAIVQAAIISIAEANIEKMLDQPDAYDTKETAEAMFQHLQADAKLLIEDSIDALKQQLIEKVVQTTYTARVNALHFDHNGQVDDIGVTIQFT